MIQQETSQEARQQRRASERVILARRNVRNFNRLEYLMNLRKAISTAKKASRELGLAYIVNEPDDTGRRDYQVCCGDDLGCFYDDSQIVEVFESGRIAA